LHDIFIIVMESENIKDERRKRKEELKDTSGKSPPIKVNPDAKESPMNIRSMREMNKDSQKSSVHNSREPSPTRKERENLEIKLKSKDSKDKEAATKERRDSKDRDRITETKIEKIKKEKTKGEHERKNSLSTGNHNTSIKASYSYDEFSSSPKDKSIVSSASAQYDDTHGRSGVKEKKYNTINGNVLNDRREEVIHENGDERTPTSNVSEDGYDSGKDSEEWFGDEIESSKTNSLTAIERLKMDRQRIKQEEEKLRKEEGF